MTLNSVCAVVVTFHPDNDVLENLSKIQPQVQSLVVVDNGSSPQELDLLRGGGAEVGFHLIENGDNLGIATALNIGVRFAQQRDMDWVLLFDQDSAVTSNYTDTMLHGFVTSQCTGNLGILVPRYIDKRLGSDLLSIEAPEGGLEAAMTSGSLLPLSIFREHGLFEDALFIDGVDYEYSLRLRSRGLHIAECTEAILLHSPGMPKVHTFRGRYLLKSANYGPIRRYYQERNKVWVARRYWSKFPYFCLKLFFYSSKDYFKILFAEKDSGKKLLACLQGSLDGIRGRMGRKDW
jgi:rhamnosyltransferase